MIRAVLCDIEGTTSSLSFVHDVLFPLSSQEMNSFVHTHLNDPDLHDEMELLKELTRSSSPDEIVKLLRQWIQEDKKDAILKKIQGKIWKTSFESGKIQAHIYPDVPEQWKRWNDSGIRIYIFSSGSVEAQKLFFQYSEAGDLSHLISGYFDTTTGPKRDAESYRRIAETIGIPPNEILFLSDTPEELDAAKESGMDVIQLDRAARHTVVSSFDQIDQQ